MKSKKVRADAEKSLDFSLRILAKMDLDEDAAFDKWTHVLSAHPDTYFIASILTAALIRLKKLEDYMKDMSIERDLSE